MARLLSRLARAVLLRYLGASVIALAADMGCFLALLRLGMPATPAAALAYALGIAVHWLISSRVVFGDAVAERGPERMRQKALFVVSALMGMAVTTGIVGLFSGFGVDPRLAKLVAIGVSFTVTWLLRNRIVFRPVPA